MGWLDTTRCGTLHAGHWASYKCQMTQIRDKMTKTPTRESRDTGRHTRWLPLNMQKTRRNAGSHRSRGGTRHGHSAHRCERGKAVREEEERVRVAQQRREVVAPVEESHDLKRQDASVRRLALAPPPNPEGGAQTSTTCRTHWRQYSGSCPRPCSRTPLLGCQSRCTTGR